MDMLQQSALAFEKLQKYEYEITAGSKKTLLEMTLFFSKEHFMHLIGLHKLTDLQIQRYRKAQMYDMVKVGVLSLDYIKKSVFFQEISERMKNFSKINRLLRS